MKVLVSLAAVAIFASAFSLSCASPADVQISTSDMTEPLAKLSSGQVLEPKPTPVDPAPADPTPVDPAPADPTPVDPAPADPAPVDPAPADPAPVDPAPADPTPVDPAPVDPALADPAPVVVAPPVVAPPAPVVVAPPVKPTPAPVVVAPPVVAPPAPVVVAPPVKPTPAPVVVAPPVVAPPAPVVVAPPVKPTPAPVVVAPPVVAPPAPVVVAPPVVAPPAPVVVAPPVVAPPAPVVVAPPVVAPPAPVVLAPQGWCGTTRSIGAVMTEAATAFDADAVMSLMEEAICILSVNNDQLSQQSWQSFVLNYGTAVEVIATGQTNRECSNLSSDNFRGEGLTAVVRGQRAVQIVVAFRGLNSDPFAENFESALSAPNLQEVAQ